MARSNTDTVASIDTESLDCNGLYCLKTNYKMYPHDEVWVEVLFVP